MNQLKALNIKNWILFKRHLLGSILQIMIPIVFIAFIFVIRLQSSHEPLKQQQLLGKENLSLIIYGQKEVALSANDSGDLYLKNCSQNEPIGIISSNYSFGQTLKNKFLALNYSVQVIASRQQLNQIVRSPLYGITSKMFCFGIQITEAIFKQSYKYQLIFNEILLFNKVQGPPTNLKVVLDTSQQMVFYNNTLKKGMIGVTTFINNLILQIQTQDSANVFRNTFGHIYQQQGQYDNIYRVSRKLILLLFLPLILVYMRQISFMLLQKQKKIRQTMTIMGTNVLYLYLSWFIRYFITYLIIHIVGCFIISTVLPHTKFQVLFVVLILFDIVLILQAFFIQTFFSQAKVGSIVALLYFFIQVSISFFQQNQQISSSQINHWVSIIPHAAILLFFQNLLYTEMIKQNLTFQTDINNFQISTCIISLCINIAVLMVLIWYCQLVFPNSSGAKKHPLFCFLNNEHQLQKNRIDNKNKQQQQKQLQFKVDIEEPSDRQNRFERQKKIINIKNLKKQFNKGEIVAVNNLNLKIYNSNIFVLLGHNGAGKTTTISMITGMIQPTSGSIQAFGDIKLQKRRQIMGICSQINALYDQLTVEQHLRLYGAIKGLNSQELQEQIDLLMTDVNIHQKKNQYSKNLSGGQKRKLSIAIAFAGRSKIIILDEPTSGMDPSSRRYVWDLLKRYKKNKIIILTTHFMDEADYLADKIGIMKKGKIICCGSNHYLKSQYGRQYRITFLKSQKTVLSKKIIDLVQRYASQAYVMSNIGYELKMQIPTKYLPIFSEMFLQIDDRAMTLQIKSYGISLASLDKVFTNIIENDNQSTQRMTQNNTITKSNINFNLDTNSIINRSQQYQYKLNEIEQNQQFYNQIPRVQGNYTIFYMHTKATLIKRLRVIKNDLKTFVFEIIAPILFITFAFVLMKLTFLNDLPKQNLSLDFYQQYSSPVKVPIGSPDSTFLINLKDQLNAKYGSKINVLQDTSSITALEFDRQSLFPRKKQIDVLLGGLFFEIPTIIGISNIHRYTTIVNSKIPTSFFFMQALGAQTIINKLQSSNITIEVSNSPFVLTYQQSQMNNAVTGFISALIISIAFAFKFSSIIGFLVLERQSKSKYQQFVSGINKFAFWLGNFIYDFTFYLILALYTVCMCFAMNSKSYINEALGVTILSLFFYGIAYIPLTYIFTHFYQDYGKAKMDFYFLTFIFGGLFNVLIFILRFYGSQYGNVGLIVAWILRIHPAFCFGQIFTSLASRIVYSLNQLNQLNFYLPWDLKISLIPLLFLIVEGIILIIVSILQQTQIGYQMIDLFSKSEQKIQCNLNLMDSNVVEMKQISLQAIPQDYQILTRNLCHVYRLNTNHQQKKQKIAVNNLSLAISKGQIFGLLGINGAGKTTIFKILSGEFKATCGQSYLQGISINENLEKIRKKIGYCPQFDALIQYLSVRQQLELYYDLKSLAQDKKQKIIKLKLHEMNLEQYEDKLSGTLSGGNKKKLLMAIATLGSPNIIFLDQPASGMDPQSRLFMWKTIQRLSIENKKSTIILTTHSMDEAQALCSRIGIMHEGNFRCLGAPQQLKQRYGQGYQVTIILRRISNIQITNLVNKLMNLQSTYFKIQNQKQQFKKQKQITIPKEQKNIQSDQIIKLKNQSLEDLHQQSLQDFYEKAQQTLLKTKKLQIQRFIIANFERCQITQSFLYLMRFKVPANISLGKVFLIVQNNKQTLSIGSYSVNQTNIEQIFNSFAQSSKQITFKNQNKQPKQSTKIHE